MWGLSEIRRGVVRMLVHVGVHGAVAEGVAVGRRTQQGDSAMGWGCSKGGVVGGGRWGSLAVARGGCCFGQGERGMNRDYEMNVFFCAQVLQKAAKSRVTNYN